MCVESTVANFHVLFCTSKYFRCFDTNVNKTEPLSVNFPTVEPNVTPTTTPIPTPTPTPTSTPLSPSHSTDAIITPAITTTARNPKVTCNIYLC